MESDALLTQSDQGFLTQESSQVLFTQDSTLDSLQQGQFLIDGESQDAEATFNQTLEDEL